jgi:RNA polymerase sigma-70 factor (ECF subfamily)
MFAAAGLLPLPHLVSDVLLRSARWAARDTTRDVVDGRPNAPLDAAMERYARGDDAAFAEIYDGLSPRLFGFLLRHTRDRSRAEDIVQQTMLQIHRARGRFAPGAELMPWAFAIARRLLIDQHRRGGREVLAPNDDDGGGDLLASLEAGADELAIAKEVAVTLARELQRLPENQRVAFELIKQDGLSVAEAAQVLGTTVAAVKLRAHRAYEALRAVLASESQKAEKIAKQGGQG